jgi:hypothetical protein
MPSWPSLPQPAPAITAAPRVKKPALPDLYHPEENHHGHPDPLVVVAV